ncbi:PH domain-containing protein [Paenibacillus sp. KN14-4R]|uniref:PH domain-containing protein n=1 Tax=Paenibacillus sp. KN14-4R TaxID=3445773 RepID=UPI003FA0625E
MFESHLKPIDEKVIDARKMEGWITIGVYAVIVISLLFVTLKFDWSMWYVIGAAILAVIAIPFEISILPNLKYKTWKYGVNEYEVELWHGLIFKRRTLIPMIRIQHVDSKQGPILRKFGLFTITFSTAAGSHEIPGLTEETAEEVRKKIAELARLGDDDV